MLKALIFFGFALMSLQSWGWSGRDVWKNATREQKLFLLEEYRIFFAKNREPLAPWKDKRSSFIQMIQNAYATELDCVFAGWPSKKVGEVCAPPATHNPGYQAGNCEAGKLQCQPMFFGTGLCVAVATENERNYSFANCTKAFADSGKTYDQILTEIEGSHKHVELLSLLDFADKACQTGFQAPLMICRRLEAAVMGLREAIEAAEKTETTEGDEDPEPELESETAGAGATTGTSSAEATSDLVSAAGTAVTLNETVQGATRVTSDCPPGTGTPTQTADQTTRGPVTAVTGVYGPEQALADINNGELTFVGRDLFQNYEERSCVYKSATAFVIYHNCMADRREHPITNVEVIAFTGQSMRFFVENTEARPEISTLTRAAYDNTWSMSFKQGPAVAAGASLADLKTHHARLEADFSGSCWIGESGGAKANGQGKCMGSLASQQSGWAQSSESFWREPSAAWATTKRMLREKVRTARF